MRLWHSNFKCKGQGASCALFVLCLVLVPFFSMSLSKKALACQSCVQLVESLETSIWEDAEENFTDQINDRFLDLEKLVLQDMWEETILPTMMLAAEEMTAVAVQQAMIVGMFIDAETQLKAQRKLQEIQSQIHKNYQPSEGMCRFGSALKSVAASDLKSEMVPLMLAQHSQNRQLGYENSSAKYGFDIDQFSRITQFKNLFCNINDRGEKIEVSGGTTTRSSALTGICSDDMKWTTALGEEERERIDKDIDYFSTIDAPWTVKADFSNQEIIDTSASPEIHNQDEEHILAMASNLYGNIVFPRPPALLLKNRPDRPLSRMQELYMEARSIVAKRSVAENSYYAIAAMKSAGNEAEDDSGDPVPGSSKPYISFILKELGIEDEDGDGDTKTEINSLLGENPSYYAQMEVLTKKIYQDPDFYTNLYDKPANVERKAAAMQAIKLMQKFDMLKSFLRGEASYSILLEMAIVQLQKEIEDQIR